MRHRKKEMVDYSKPVDINLLIPVDGDCFGSLWESTDKECVKCDKYDLCMVVTKSKNKDKAKKIEKKYGSFLDTIDWDSVPWDKLLIEIGKGGIMLSDVRQLVKDLSKCSDDKTVFHKVQNWMISNNVKVKEGCLYLS